MNAIARLALAALLVAGAAPEAGAQGGALRLPALFSDHMVLQRDHPVRVWGWDAPGRRVTVTLAGRSASAVAGADSAWRVELPAMRAGGPHRLTVAGSSTRRLEDVLVGDLWVASGQSNMEWPLSAVDGAEAEIAGATDSRIRIFTVTKDVADAPRADVRSDGWEVATAATVPDFSAIAYLFGQRLRRELGVPIGLIDSTWGGTVAEAWTSAAGLRAVPEIAERAAAIRPGSISLARQAELNAQTAARTAEWQRAVAARDSGYAAGRRPWADPAYDASDWKAAELPGLWDDGPLPGHDGTVWYRREVELGAGWAGRQTTLELGRVHAADSVWINGTLVGQSGANGQDRRYRLPAGTLRPGRNVIVARVLSASGRGGIYGEPSTLALRSADGAWVPLAGEWRYRVGADLRDLPEPVRLGNLHNQPTALFNAMIAPLTPMPVRGVIWYQGESNAGRPEQYRTLFPAMIRDWRAAWGQPELPFLFVQLANYLPRQQDPNVASDWAYLRESQAAALSLPATGMVTAIDLGEADDIHPRGKKPVAERLALAALRTAYGREVAASGPMLRATMHEPGALRLRFDHAPGGLVSRAGALGGFAVAGSDGRWHAADAVIDGSDVVVSSRSVVRPTMARYGWADNPLATLYNRAGLPAAPFRTDNLPRPTAGR